MDMEYLHSLLGQKDEFAILVIGNLHVAKSQPVAFVDSDKPGLVVYQPLNNFAGAVIFLF